MTKLTKISITAILIALLGYALTYNPNGKYLIPVAKLIEKKAITAQQTNDSRVHTLDLEKMRR